jgi:hypothetical protein
MGSATSVLSSDWLAILKPTVTIGDSLLLLLPVQNLAISMDGEKETSVPSLYTGTIRFTASAKVSFRLVQYVSIR